MPHGVTPDLPTILVVNPHARHGREKFEHYRRALSRTLNLSAATLTSSPDDMRRTIVDALSYGIKRVVVGGGDGTLSAAADVLRSTEGVLAVLPLGTGNTFSRGLGLPEETDRMVHLIAAGPLACYDLGLAIKGDREKVFLNSLTIGVSQRLVELLTRELKQRWGYLAWGLELRRALTHTQAINIKLSWPGGSDDYATRQLVIVNGRTIAAGLAATPGSSGQDGLLEVFRLGDPRGWSMLRIGLSMLTGNLLHDRDARYVTLTSLRLETTPMMPTNIDGEVWESTPIHCRILPASLWVITPSKSGHLPRRWPFVTHTLVPRNLAPPSSLPMEHEF